MKSISMNGTNESGFNALGSGSRADADGNFYQEGNYAVWWSTYNTVSIWYAGTCYVTSTQNSVDPTYNYFKSTGYTVRCVKD